MPDSLYCADEHTTYGTLDGLSTHQVVTHSKDEYVRDNVYINCIEGFWSLPKIFCMHIMVFQKHISHYIASIPSLGTITKMKICLIS